MSFMPDLAPAPADGFPVYPGDFPFAARLPYSYAVDMGVIRSEMAAGNARQRRIFRTMPHALALAFELRVTELYLWQGWVNAFAFDWFYCPVSTMYAAGPPEAQTVRYELVRFTGDLGVTMNGHNLVSVAVAAELSPQAFADAPPAGVGPWVVAGTPGASSTDWMIGGSPAAPSPATCIAGSPAFPASL